MAVKPVNLVVVKTATVKYGEPMMVVAVRQVVGENGKKKRVRAGGENGNGETGEPWVGGDPANYSSDATLRSSHNTTDHWGPHAEPSYFFKNGFQQKLLIKLLILIILMVKVLSNGSDFTGS